MRWKVWDENLEREMENWLVWAWKRKLLFDNYLNEFLFNSPLHTSVCCLWQLSRMSAFSMDWTHDRPASQTSFYKPSAFLQWHLLYLLATGSKGSVLDLHGMVMLLPAVCWMHCCHQENSWCLSQGNKDNWKACVSPPPLFDCPIKKSLFW